MPGINIHGSSSGGAGTSGGSQAGGGGADFRAAGGVNQQRFGMSPSQFAKLTAVFDPITREQVTDIRKLRRIEYNTRMTAIRETERDLKSLEQERVKIERTAIRKREVSERVIERAQVQQQRKLETIFERSVLIGAAGGYLLQGNIKGAFGSVAGAAGGGVGSMIGGSFGGIPGAKAGGIIGAIIAELAAASINAPSAAFGSAKLAADLKTKAFAVGRMGGSNFFGGFDRGSWGAQPSADMVAAGMTPSSMMDSLMALGIGGTGKGSRALSLAMGGMANTSNAFAGMANGTVEGILRQGMGMGMSNANPNAAISYASPVMRLFEEALSRGVDRTKLADTLTNTMDLLARTGAGGVSNAAMVDLMGRLMLTGSAGGRTGATAANIAGGVSSAMGNLAGSPSSAVALMMNSGVTKNLSSAGGIASLLGTTAGALTGTPQGKDAVSRITGLAKEGATWQALQSFGAYFGQGNPSASMKLFMPAAQQAAGGDPGMLPIWLSKFANVSLADAQNYLSIPSNVSGPGGFNKWADVRGLIAKGVPANLANMFVSAGAKTGVNPGMLAALAKTESSFLGRPHTNSNGTTDFGMMQLNSRTHPNAAKLSVMDNIMAGATQFKGDLLRRNGDPSQAYALYNGSQKYVSNFNRNLTGMFGGQVPTDVFQGQARAAQNDLQLSMTALNQLVPLAGHAADAVDSFTNALRQFGTVIGSRAGFGHHAAM